MPGSTATFCRIPSSKTFIACRPAGNVAVRNIPPSGVVWERVGIRSSKRSHIEPALTAVDRDNLLYVGIEVVRCQVPVQDLLAEEIRVQVCGLLCGIERREDLLWGVHPPDPHARRRDLGE